MKKTVKPLKVRKLTLDKETLRQLVLGAAWYHSPRALASSASAPIPARTSSTPALDDLEQLDPLLSCHSRVIGDRQGVRPSRRDPDRGARWVNG